MAVMPAGGTTAGTAPGAFDDKAGCRVLDPWWRGRSRPGRICPGEGRCWVLAGNPEFGDAPSCTLASRRANTTSLAAPAWTLQFGYGGARYHRRFFGHTSPGRSIYRARWPSAAPASLRPTDAGHRRSQPGRNGERHNHLAAETEDGAGEVRYASQARSSRWIHILRAPSPIAGRACATAPRQSTSASWPRP